MRYFSKVPKPLADRIFEKVRKTGSGCWLWTGATDGNGYGRIFLRRNDGKATYESVHRLMYMLFRGPIPEGTEPDHTCRVRACVNPGHLEAVTHKVNVLRGVGIASHNAAKTHCVRGHSLDGAKIYRGRRVCVECDKLRMQRITAKRRLSNKKRMFFIDKEGNYACVKLEPRILETSESGKKWCRKVQP